MRERRDPLPEYRAWSRGVAESGVVSPDGDRFTDDPLVAVFVQVRLAAEALDRMMPGCLVDFLSYTDHVFGRR